MSKIAMIGTLVSSALLIVLFQNCAPQLIAGQWDLAEKAPPVRNNLAAILSDNRILSLQTSGQLVSQSSQCSSSPQFDACLFFKNPVAQRLAPYPTVLGLLDQRADLDQRFGVKFTDLDGSGFLSSTSFQIFPSLDVNLPRRPVAQGFKSLYSSDTHSLLPQASAYFFLNATVAEFERRIGLFYAKNKSIPVIANAVDTNSILPIKDNAFFEFGGGLPSGRIVMGYASSGVNVAHPMALSAEVYVHELGHANLYHAQGGAYASLSRDTNAAQIIDIYDVTSGQQPSRQNFLRTEVRELFRTVSSRFPVGFPVESGRALFINLRNSFCLTSKGCLSAINEGQADFHALMMFPEHPSIGETFLNSLDGLVAGAISRNPETLMQSLQSYSGSLKLNRVYDLLETAVVDPQGTPIMVNGSPSKIKGQIHGMGAALSAILWNIYKNGQNVQRRHFEYAFHLTLQDLTAQDDLHSFFISMLENDIEFCQGINQVALIRGFADWGIQR